MTDELRVEAPAISLGGTVYTLPRPARHEDVVSLMTEQGVRHTFEPDTYGFLLSDGRFVRRKAALRVAKMAGQMLPGATPRLGELTTTEVW